MLNKLQKAILKSYSRFLIPFTNLNISFYNYSIVNLIGWGATASAWDKFRHGLWLETYEGRFVLVDKPSLITLSQSYVRQLANGKVLVQVGEWTKRLGEEGICSVRLRGRDFVFKTKTLLELDTPILKKRRRYVNKIKRMLSTGELRLYKDEEVNVDDLFKITDLWYKGRRGHYYRLWGKRRTESILENIKELIGTKLVHVFLLYDNRLKEPISYGVGSIINMAYWSMPLRKRRYDLDVEIGSYRHGIDLFGLHYLAHVFREYPYSNDGLGDTRRGGLSSFKMMFIPMLLPSYNLYPRYRG